MFSIGSFSQASLNSRLPVHQNIPLYTSVQRPPQSRLTSPLGLGLIATPSRQSRLQGLVTQAKPDDRGSDLQKQEASIQSLMIRYAKGELNQDEQKLLFSKCSEGLQNTKAALPGVAIGIPLVQLAALFTSLHYDENIIGLKDVYLQFCVGYLTYGFDRLRDALDAEDIESLAPEKQALYRSILDHQTSIIATLSASAALVFRELANQPETLPFIPLLFSTFAYKEIKTEFGAAKPFYIATLWTLATVVLPSVMHDHDYSILADPQAYLPMALLMFGATTLADVKDFKEDEQNQVQTLARQLGYHQSIGLSTASILLSALMLYKHFSA